MIKNVTNKIENEKIGKIKSKKSKSINKEKIKEKNMSLNYLSNRFYKNNKNKKYLVALNQGGNNKKNLNLFFRKRKSKIEIDANKFVVLKINSEKNIPNKIEDNKDNYFTENLNQKIKENYFKKKIEKINDIVNNEAIIKKPKLEENKEKVLNDKYESKKIIENINSKNDNDVPLLQLNSIKSSSSSSSKSKSKSDLKNKKSVSSEDNTESSYNNSNNFEIKGEHLSKNEKKIFLNNIKKCLFNTKNANIKNDVFKLNNRTNKINLKENLSFFENNLNINIHSSHITKAGLDEKKEKINQDSFLILEKIFENNISIYGIFDGHGKNGHLISSLVSKFLYQYLTKKENYCTKNNNDSNESYESDSSLSDKKEIIITKELLSSLFSKEDFIKKIISELELKSNECDFDLQFSGTTCLLLFILNDTLICSNIGDSICVLFNCSNEDRWTTEILSKIHKPDIPSEHERIILNGGVIHPYYDEFGVYEGPNRVYAKGKTYPGLSLTRTIGDLEGEKIGIISEPEIVIKKIDSTSKYVVMGSDGLWDVVKPYDVRRIVTPYFMKKDAEGACKALGKIASRNWEKDGCDRDDITIIVIFLGTPD